MPELPEVETLRRSLTPHIKGKKIKSVEVLHQKTVAHNKNFTKKLTGLTIKDVNRIAKLLLFTFKQTDEQLAVHLKMTGQLLYAKQSKAGLPAEARRAKAGGGHTLSEADLNLPTSHTRVIITLNDGSKLFFNDQRLFGYMKLFCPKEVEMVKSKYGIEPGTDDFTWENFQQIFINRKTSIKALLLNQSVIAGLGNIYVDEACFYAGIKPTCNVQRATLAQKKKLFEGINHIISRAIKKGGTTFYSFAHADGKKGSFLNELKVFARKGEPCKKCKEPISKTVCAGRGTHYCPKCQQ